MQGYGTLILNGFSVFLIRGCSLKRRTAVAAELRTKPVTYDLADRTGKYCQLGAAAAAELGARPMVGCIAARASHGGQGDTVVSGKHGVLPGVEGVAVRTIHILIALISGLRGSTVVFMTPLG